MGAWRVAGATSVAVNSAIRVTPDPSNPRVGVNVVELARRPPIVPAQSVVADLRGVPFTGVPGVCNLSGQWSFDLGGFA